MPPIEPNNLTPHHSNTKTTITLVSLLAKLFGILFRSIIIILLLLTIPIIMRDITTELTLVNKPSSIVVASWQRINLLQQELPQDNSLPSPLPDQNLTDTWGAARSEGRSHEGIDIFAPRNTPIQATTAGIISRIGDDRLGGKVVVIVGPGGAGHYYAHMEDYADIQTNDWVEAGDIIGYVGDSGNAKGTPPHVHYGVYINGNAVNPYPLLSK